MSVEYFKKEMISSPLRLPNGRPVPFMQLGQSSTGLIETENPDLIAELERAVARKVGGVVKITAQQAEELKKKPPVTKLRSSFNMHALINPLRRQGAANGQGAVGKAAASPPAPPKESEPLSVPDKIPMVTSVRAVRGRRAKAIGNVAGGADLVPPAVPVIP